MITTVSTQHCVGGPPCTDWRAQANRLQGVLVQPGLEVWPLAHGGSLAALCGTTQFWSLPATYTVVRSLRVDDCKLFSFPLCLAK